MKNTFIFLLMICGLCATAQTKPKPKSKPAADSRFSIQIFGKVAHDCNAPTAVAFGDFHGSDTEVQKMSLNDKGEFTAAYWLKEPGLFYFKKGDQTQYFMVSPNERVYKITLSCTNEKLNPLQVENSKENKAYQGFLKLRQKLSAELDGYRTKNLDEIAVFNEFTGELWEHQTQLAALLKQYPQTYAAKHLVAADRISEKDLTSIQSLRQNYLKRPVFADQRFYNTTLPTLILDDYVNLILEKDNSAFTAFDWILNTASKNRDAARRLQDVLYEVIAKSKRQDLMNGYIHWMQAHPEKMVHEVVQAKLSGLAKSMVGAPIINISLKDTLGNTQELKSIAASSKYTLLAFYSPGCGHCQEALPKLGPIAEQYKPKGFKMFTVAAHNERPEWVGFIKKYMGYGWTNVMEESNNMDFGAYTITSLPYFILIDSQGKIVSRMDAHAVLTGIPKWFETP